MRFIKLEAATWQSSHTITGRVPRRCTIDHCQLPALIGHIYIHSILNKTKIAQAEANVNIQRQEGNRHSPSQTSIGHWCHTSGYYGYQCHTHRGLLYHACILDGSASHSDWSWLTYPMKQVYSNVCLVHFTACTGYSYIKHYFCLKPQHVH